MNVLKDTITPNTTLRQFLDNKKTWGGIGIDIVNTDARIADVNVGGFDLCVRDYGQPRPNIINLFGDCNSGVKFEQVHDVSKTGVSMELWPFLAPAPGYLSYAISGIADNGAGLYRITVPANIIATGDTFFVRAPVGAEGAQGKWVATYVDATHIDLQGSNTAPTTTANTTINRTYISVTSTDNLRVGQGVSGTGIPVGATVGGVWPEASAISLDKAHPATATNLGVTLTFTNSPYVSGGAANIDGFYRPGTGVDVSHSEGMQFYAAFTFEYATNFLFGNDVLTATCYACGVDSFINSAGWGINGVVFRADPGHLNYGNVFSGGWLTTLETAIVSNTPTTDLHNSVINVAHNVGISKDFEIVSGGIVISNYSSISSKQSLYKIGNDFYMIGVNIPAADIYTNDDTYSYMRADGTTQLKGNPLVGQNYAQSLTTTRVTASGDSSSVMWHSDSAGADQKNWGLAVTASGNLVLSADNDAISASNPYLVFNRGAGYTVGTTQFNSPVVGGTAANSILRFKSTANTSPTTAAIEFYAGGSKLAGRVEAGAHFLPGGIDTPTIASGACGTGSNGAVLAGSNDQGMQITIGAAATTTCTIDFAITWNNAPRSCWITSMNAAASGTSPSMSWSTTQVILAGTALANAKYAIGCH